jgi:flagellar M-ring protein FliF
MRQLLDSLKVLTDRFTFNQKILMLAIVAAGVLSVGMFGVWLKSEEKTVLFTNLSPEDASLAISELDKKNVESVLTDGGTTILVPEGMVHKLRVDLSAKGIPSSGTVGWGIFDGKQYGMTEFLQNVNYKRALEGELTKTIETIQGIRAARIHLVMPKPSIFKKMQAPATASVVLTLGQSSVLSPNQIRGIQSLVSGSVEGLELPNVAVLDQYGVVLSESYEGVGYGQSEGQLALKKEVDAYLTEKAETMLARVLGPGRSIVRVDATLDFDRLEQQRHSFDPEKTVVRSEERSEASGAQDGTNETSVTNYEINEVIETVIGEVGDVKSMTVAVFVDGRYEEAQGDAAPAYTPLSDEELQQIQRVVTSAVGLNAQRGDRIEVVNMQFRAPEESAPESGGLGGLPLPGSLPQVVGKVLLFVLALFMALRLKKALGDMMGQQLIPQGVSREEFVEAKSDLLDTDESVTSTENKLKEIRDYAGASPQEIADLVQAWVHEAEGATASPRG